MKLISWYLNNLLIEHFDMNKIIELISQKYDLLNPKKNVKAYINKCDVYLLSKTIRRKL